MTIQTTVNACAANLSRADKRELAGSNGAAYALEWTQWAKRSGMPALQGYTATQLEHVASLLHAAVAPAPVRFTHRIS